MASCSLLFKCSTKVGISNGRAACACMSISPPVVRCGHAHLTNAQTAPSISVPPTLGLGQRLTQVRPVVLHIAHVRADFPRPHKIRIKWSEQVNREPVGITGIKPSAI